jgi:Sigma-70 region 2
MTRPTPSVGTESSRFENIPTRESIVARPAALILRYGRAIRGYAVAQLGEQDADDFVNTFCVKVLGGAFEHWTPGERRFRDYLKAAVRNAIADFQRRENRRNKPALGQPAGLSTCEAPDEDWLDCYLPNVLDLAFKALRTYQEEHPGNVYYTLVQILGEGGLIDDRKIDYREVVEKLRQATGRAFTVDNARQLRRRACRKLAELLVAEVWLTLGRQTVEDLEEELHLLGVLPYIGGFLPADWKQRVATGLWPERKPELVPPALASER